MLPNQEEKEKLSKLLEKLFEDDESGDIQVLRGPGPEPFGNCCTYNYSDY